MNAERRLSLVIALASLPAILALTAIGLLRDSRPTADDSAALQTKQPVTRQSRSPETPPMTVATDEGPIDGPGARLLQDSDNARDHALAMSIRQAGFECLEVRSAVALNRNGDAWRAHCGATRLYWIEIDDTGRMRVEPGAYQEPPGDRSTPVRRTLELREEGVE